MVSRQRFRDGPIECEGEVTMDSDTQRPELSIVSPMFNESLNLDFFFERLMPVLNSVALEYELICVNDGSSDDTLARLLHYRRANDRIKVIDLSRNFGKEIALTAGIDHALGRAVVPIDADLQDPPELIGQFVAKWREGYDVVYGRRRSRRGDSWLKRFTANAFYRVLGHLTEIPIPPDTGDFRLLDRQVVDALGTLPERTRFMKGLFAWVGFNQTYVLYDRQPRHSGKTTWNYWRLWNYAVDGITAFSSLPLRIWSYCGLTLSSVAFLYALFLLGRTIYSGIDVPGYASTVVIVLFLGGIQLISLGVIGEYIGRIYSEVKARPLYLIRERFGVEPEMKEK